MEKFFTGWIKPGNYGEEVVDGVKYTRNYPLWVIPILRVVKAAQKSLWFCGVAIHDPIFGECTPDFNCCVDIGRRAVVKFPSQKTKSDKMFEEWLRAVCFQRPTQEAYDLAKAAWNKASKI
ncbi:hypothetical protein KAR91_12190 [Candidatus Pacearchaeota archaeon]|nr:hypothetical protein [Candidatus Pacearchaeota archaeon]